MLTLKEKLTEASSSVKKTTMAEERRWDELNRDLLVQIFDRVGIESLGESVQFVCKSWYNATLDPRFWRIIDLRFIDHDSSDFLQFVLRRSQRSATTIWLHSNCCLEDLILISEECPELKNLAIPSRSDILVRNGILLSRLIYKWKNLENLSLGSSRNFKEIMMSVSMHCKNFVGLEFYNFNIGCEFTSTIVRYIPKIKYLSILDLYIPRECIVTILKGCRDLEHLEIRCYVACFGVDSEIMKLASHINAFNCASIP